MGGACTSCQTALEAAPALGRISQSLCSACLEIVAMGEHAPACRAILQGIDTPVLMVQSNPRLVFTANDKALALFAKSLPKAEGHRGGEVFNCVHSYTEAGCGKDVNCEDCKIKAAIVATFEGTPANEVSSTLVIRQRQDRPHHLTISSEPVGRFALVRIDGFTPSQET